MGGASREDFASVLADLRFIPRDYLKAMRGRSGETEQNLPENSNSNVKRVIKGALCAGFYPNVVKVRHPEQKYVATSGGFLAKDAEGRQLRFYTRDVGRV